MKHILEVFIAYSHQDLQWKNAIKNSLAPLVNKGILLTWDDHDIEPGSNWDQTINEKLYQADIILLLVSPDSLSSDYFNSKEIAIALQRHEKKEVTVLPIILRPCLWDMTPISKLEALPEKALPISQWRSTDDAIYDVSSKLKDIFLRKLEEGKSSKRVEKIDNRLKNSTPEWIYRKFPRWLQCFFAEYGIIQVHHLSGGALYELTKIREMLKKQSLDARMHYIQMKMAEAEREADLETRICELAMVWGLCEEIKELADKRQYPETEKVRIAALFAIIKNKYNTQESARDAIRQAESDARTNEYYAEIDRKVRLSLNQYKFENYILRFSIKEVNSWYGGYLSFFFDRSLSDVSKRIVEYAQVGDFLKAGDTFMVKYKIKSLVPVTGLLISYPIGDYLEIRPIKGQTVPSDLGLFMFGHLIEFVQTIEKNRPPHFAERLTGKWTPEKVQKWLEDLKQIEVSTHPIESDKWYETR